MTLPETTVDEIAAGIYRISTFMPDVVPPAGFTFNQFLIDADEPLLFHTGHRRAFPVLAEAVRRVLPLERLRWITFGHVEADECGAMNEWLAAAPAATVAHGGTGVLVSLTDLADRPPQILEDGETVDLGGKRVRWLDTPHVPHGWEAGVLYEETTGTLLCGDLFTQFGRRDPLVEDDVLEAAIEAEMAMRFTAVTPSTGPTVRRLADLEPATLALMHGPSFRGDGAAALRGLAGAYDDMLQSAVRTA